MRVLFAILAALVATSADAQSMKGAEPPMLFDSGRSQPIAKYLDRLEIKLNAPPPEPNPPTPATTRFPLTSPGLSVGRVGARSLPKLRNVERRAGMRPLFLIGTDAVSYEWMARNHAYLSEIKAIGMVVEAETKSDFEEAFQQANGLVLFPASATSIAAELSLKHYPVLITPDGIEQ